MILTELARYYDRLVDQGRAPPYGFSSEKISFCLTISTDGEPVALSDLREGEGKKRAPRLMEVPAAVKRAVNIAPNFLWDKTAYVLGVVAEETTIDGKKAVVPVVGKRTAQEHEAFKAMHREALAGAEDEGLRALLAFLDKWTPERFAALGFSPEALDANIVFRLDGEMSFLHQRPAARRFQEARAQPKGDEKPCLVSGGKGAAARLHPGIKGAGGQAAGASLVSFNLDAFTSYGKAQGDNAPVSEAAAFAYGASLNTLLRSDPANRQKHRIGETTVVFWADAEAATGQAAEEVIAWLDDPVDLDKLGLDARNRIEPVMKAMSEGGRARLAALRPELPMGTRVHLLGLAPNNARLAVRFWRSGALGDFVDRFIEHYSDLRLEPPAFRVPPSAWLLLLETAILRKSENIPPLLEGALMTAVLSGSAYPRPLLAAVIGRIRAEGDLSPLRAAICKACVVRDGRSLHDRKEDLVSLDPTSEDVAYNLGRLFAAYAYAEKSYIERNASIRDKYMGAASANPRRVFPTLMRGYEHNRSALDKAGGQKAGAGVKAEKAVQQILENLKGAEDLPALLPLEDQGRFFVGYYHQERALYTGKDAAGDAGQKDQAS